MHFRCQSDRNHQPTTQPVAAQYVATIDRCSDIGKIDRAFGFRSAGVLQYGNAGGGSIEGCCSRSGPICYNE
jgi:hypothetical protein